MRLSFLTILLLLLVGCKKPSTDIDVPPEFTNGFFALNEGLFQQNNSSIAFYSNENKTLVPQLFSKINGRGLGDTANDMISFVYKGQLFYAVVVNVSSQIEIINGLTLESVAQIGLFNSGIGRSPRTIQFYDDQLYTINFDGTVSVINLNSFTEVLNIEVGQNPESSIIFQNHLFVVNTGGLNFPDYDSTISVINLKNNTVISTFTSGLNGSEIIINQSNEGYMISRGNYADIKPRLQHIDMNNHALLDSYQLNIITMAYANGTIYYYDDIANSIFRFNTENKQKDSEVFIDCKIFQNVYKIIINENQQLMYIIDANGYVNSSIIRIYDLQGNYQREIISGLNTNTLTFIP